MQYSLGNYLALRPQSPTVIYRFQNFFINQTAKLIGLEGNEQQYTFLPFGFSGVTINRTGDNVESSLVFPNTDLSRAWGTEALEDRWLAFVNVVMLNPDDNTQGTIMHNYVGQVASGFWDETSLTLNLSTVLDAVGTNVPARSISQNLVGALPMTSAISLR